MGWMTEELEFEFRYGQEFHLPRIQTGFEAHLASYSISTNGSFPEGRVVRM
jgi:hypothetical protein